MLMIRVENIDTYGFEAAIRGMRNPMNSWEKSDSIFDYPYTSEVGQNDLNLMRRLYNAGTEHRKNLRMINVTMDITAPLYWWKEMDQYRVGVTTNSCSTMHKIHDKEFTLDDFSHEYFEDDELLSYIIDVLNSYRNLYNREHKKTDWYQMIQLLPSSYNQRRTVQLSYETVFNIIRQREKHKLDEWVQFVDILKGLPYVKELMTC